MAEAILDKLARSVDMYMPLLALCVYLWLWKKIKRQQLLLLIYLISNVLFGAVTDVMGFFHINNLALYHFDTLYEQWLVSFYLATKIIDGKIPLLYYFINIGYTIFWIINIIGWEPLNIFNSNSAVVSNLILLLICMYYMLDLSKKDEILYFQKLPSFWIVSAFLIYSALTILIFAVYKYYIIQNLIDEGNKIWNLMYITIPIKFIMISVGLLCYKKTISIPKPLLL